MKKVFAVSILCVAVLAAIPAFAGIIILGQPPDQGNGNCFPFGCAYGFGDTAEYQQVYSSTQFSGSITITALQFFNTQINSGATEMNSGTWTIALSTTSADWNTLSGNFASNLGSNNTVVFSGNLDQPWTFGDTLNITLTTPFTYNPANGNLLMDVMVSGASDNGPIFFDTNSNNDYMGRVFCPSGLPCSTGTVESGNGLVTGISYGSSTTPEPDTLVMFGSGVLGLAGLLRRKFLV